MFIWNPYVHPDKLHLMKETIYQLLQAVWRIEKQLNHFTVAREQSAPAPPKGEEPRENTEAYLHESGRELYYREDELYTVKEACHILKVSRWKIGDMGQKGELTCLKRKGHVRLLRTEVEKAKLWYSIPKGKI